ncbi:MAG: YiiX/YebB-like N1pC/P60 family cysteine hydrolase [Gammaproteobacteria bacterium]
MKRQHLIDSIQPGDIVFIRVANFLYRRVGTATASWTTHVGFIDGKENGEWQVAESTFPRSKRGSFSAFLARSENGQFGVRRIRRTLNEEDLQAMRMASEARMGRWYDARFDFDRGGLYCSKFVYQVFKEALDEEVGQVESFRQLLDRTPDAPRTFWRFWFFGRIPWQQRTVTPASQWLDERLITVGSWGVSSR